MEESDLRYQAIYFDESANWSNRIVLLREVFPDPSTNVAILKSLRLEEKSALVICGTLSKLRYFRKLLKHYDEQYRIGKLQKDEVFVVIKRIIEKANLKIAYKQSMEDVPIAVTAEPKVAKKTPIKDIFNGIWDFGKDFKKEWNKQSKEQKKQQEDLLKFLKDNWSKIKRLETVFDSHPRAAYILENISDDMEITGESLGVLTELLSDPEWVEAIGLKNHWEQNDWDDDGDPNGLENLIQILPKGAMKTNGNQTIIKLKKTDKSLVAARQFLKDNDFKYKEKEILGFVVEIAGENLQAFDGIQGVFKEKTGVTTYTISAEDLKKVKEKADSSKLKYKVRPHDRVIISFSGVKQKKKLKNVSVTANPKLVIKNIKNVFKKLHLEKQGFGAKPEKLEQDVNTFLKMMEFDIKKAKIFVDGYKVTIEVNKNEYSELQDLIKAANIEPKDLLEPILKVE